MVPVLVIVPPVIGEVVAIEVTVPLPPGLVHEGDPAEVSCKYFVPDVLPGKSAQDVQPLE
jgi:hypothetical protein